MRQNHSILGESLTACVRKVRIFDAKMDDFGHTATRRGAFTPRRRRECSKLHAVPCASLLAAGQNRSRLNSTLIVNRP